MPLAFFDFPFPAMKNMVDQMSNADLVRVSLQSQRADKALKECGKNVSFFNLDGDEMGRLSEFDKMEMFLLEVARQGTLPEWPVKLLVKLSKKFQLTFKNYEKNFSFSFDFESFKNMENYSGVRKNVMIGDNYIPILITDDQECIRSFWNDKTAGLISVLQFLRDSYDMPIDHLDVVGDDRQDYSKNLRRVLHFCSQMNVRDASAEKLSDDDYTFVLENLEVTETFRAESETSESFQFNGKIKSNSFRIENGHWFEIENLLSGKDYENIEVEGSKITKDELRIFLNAWKEGEFPKLRGLYIEKSMEDSLEVVRGFERHRRRLRRPIIERHVVIAIKGHGKSYATIMNGAGDEIFDMRVGSVDEDGYSG